MKNKPHIQCSFLGVGTLLLFLSDLKGYSYLCKLNEIRFGNISLLVLQLSRFVLIKIHLKGNVLHLTDDLYIMVKIMCVCLYVTNSVIDVHQLIFGLVLFLNL